MAYTVEFSPGASRQLSKLPRAIGPRMSQAIDGLADDPRPPGYIKLHGRGEQYRIRVGDYRVVYEIHDDVLTVLVVEAGHRGSVY